MEGTVTKPMSVRSVERNRIARVKVKPEPRSSQELAQDLALLKEQTVSFFVNVRGLSSSGLNPKSVVDTSVVTAEDLEEVWGKVSTYRTTNTKLHPETRKELVTLYGKIYGTEDVTNNEFMLWVVKGFVLECKGEDVDWATAAASTAREKADRCLRELEKSRLLESGLGRGGNSQGSGGASPGSPPVYSFSTKVGKPSTKLGIAKRSGSSNLTKFSSGLEQEKRPVCPADLAAVEDVLQSEAELLDSANKRVSLLGEARRKEGDRIIGLRYSMDDRKSAAKESEESVKAIECALLSTEAEISRLTQAVIAVQGDGATSVDGEALLVQINALKVERDRNARKLEIAKFALEENNRRAVQGEELYQTAQIGLWKSNSDFKLLQRQITEMSRRRAAIEDHIHSMKEGAGVSLCPRPVRHGDTEWDDTILELEPCSFCNGRFSFFDIVVASCRHLYHPFCIASLCGKQNRCVTCGDIFHPSWWRSFGFLNLGSELREAVLELDPTEVKKDVKRYFEDDSGVQVTNGSHKQSDLGSSGSTFLSNKGELEPQATVMPSVEEDLDNGFTRTSAGEEVKSPVRKPHARKSTSAGEEVNSPVKKKHVRISPVTKLPAQMSAVEDSIVTGILMEVVSSDAHLKGTEVPLVTECAAQEGLKATEISVDVDGGEKEDQPKEDPQGAVPKTQRYSFGRRNEPGPLNEDGRIPKTISLSLVCPVVSHSGAGVLTTKASKRKGTQKTEEDASRKTHARKYDNKKSESEAAETATDNSTARVLRSSAKPAQ